ncbi:hypothetical protein A3860_39500 [Niastella vici]|uniref:Zinc chelation protein SecC n=1 Tax=Niastella vici TaxID=1703345 RepID=A0A1V9FK78_9BACT|nr:SEC-C metal-binding domain-containing protein [Niastella vici]OQP58697.1 hypothetical protein A3860_39500 [Niastella vici]
MSIIKSSGVTSTEKLLAELCESTFLKLWSYPNPFKMDGKELCDVMAVFENHVFLFFDRESKKFENPDGDIHVQWARWEKEVIQKQIKTAAGAKRYVLENPDKVYLDSRCSIPFPIPIEKENLTVHKIIIAHGASNACKNFSPQNISGSLGIIYCDERSFMPTNPFTVFLEREQPVHIFDSFNLEIILRELDTVYDFSAYLAVKEKAINTLMGLCYSGEEDLLAYYYSNFDNNKKEYFISPSQSKAQYLYVEEGMWQSFICKPAYSRRNEANKASELWDSLLQRTCQNALDDTLGGNSNIFGGQSAIFEMAKEPRHWRRTISEVIKHSIDTFPGDGTRLYRNLTVLSSFYKDKAYVFLQLHHPNKGDYENEYRPRRQKILEVACGITKNKYPHFKKIIGIAIDAPKFTDTNSEDFILLNCEEWSEIDRKTYEELNKGFNFLETSSLNKSIIRTNDFPADNITIKPAKIGRNDQCPCGSQKKYKKCCLN